MDATRSTPTSARSTPDPQAILACLQQVYDPELDESIVALGFVDEIRIVGATVTVVYKLPTFWCAPIFAYMMAEDIRRAVQRLPGVAQVLIELRNNCAADEITTGVNADRSFAEIFPDDVDARNLDEVRRRLQIKGFLARQDALLQRLRQAGLPDDLLLRLTIAALQPTGEDVVVRVDQRQQRVPRAAGDLQRYLHRRRLLGLPTDAQALLFTTSTGQPLRSDELSTYLRHSRAARLNIAFNTSLCQGLFRATYEPAPTQHAASLGDALLTIK
ncbi:iron-sulfur cluster assembly protein [Kallotenue papyrolyticum]|uniref:iron-sulfur cluster assembly protein n=1 Tax=Kallotenue papyrolyticum TaxID=1325125 RepID=UPI00047859BD|nr:iron-sulfur cluster assembly protein [Kallotenue papyrolyticum]